MDAPGRPTSFIVRVSWGEAGKVTGTVERVATGERRPFASLETLPELIAELSEATDRPST